MKRIDPIRWIVPLAAFFLLTPSISKAAAATATSAGILFCCHDSAGKQTCSDILPAACYGKVYREIGPSGRTLRTVHPPPPPPTAEEIAKKNAENEKKRKEEELALEQKRKDNALLDTYGSVRDIEAMRERALGDTSKEIKAAEESITHMLEKKKKLEEDMASYKKKDDIPAETRNTIDEIDTKIKIQQEFIEEKKKDTALIQKKYDDEKKRYIELTSNKQK